MKKRYLNRFTQISPSLFKKGEKIIHIPNGLPFADTRVKWYLYKQIPRNGLFSAIYTTLSEIKFNNKDVTFEELLFEAEKINERFAIEPFNSEEIKAPVRKAFLNPKEITNKKYYWFNPNINWMVGEKLDCFHSFRKASSTQTIQMAVDLMLEHLQYKTYQITPKEVKEVIDSYLDKSLSHLTIKKYLKSIIGQQEEFDYKSNNISNSINEAIKKLELEGKKTTIRNIALYSSLSKTTIQKYRAQAEQELYTKEIEPTPVQEVIVVPDSPKQPTIETVKQTQQRVEQKCKQVDQNLKDRLLKSFKSNIYA
jgi:hypothetical protein